MEKLFSALLAMCVGFFVSTYVAQPYFNVIKESLLANGDSLQHATLVYNLYYYVCIFAVTCLIYIVIWLIKTILYFFKKNDGEVIL